MDQVGRMLYAEKIMLFVRLLTIPFALLQIYTYYLPYPDHMQSLALITVALLAVITIILWFWYHRITTEREAKILSWTALGLDSLVVCMFISVFTFDVNTAIFIMIYILPLAAACRFGFKAAIWTMIAATVFYVSREIIGAHVYGYEFLPESVTFRMGMGFVFALISGILAQSWLREKERVAQLYEHEKNAAEALRDLDNLKNNFLSAIAHELRTPLTSVMGFAMTLQDTGEFSQSDDKMMVDQIAHESVKLGIILDDLLDVNRLSKGQLPSSPKNFDASRVVKHLVDDAVRMYHRDISFTPASIFAYTDQTHLERIVDNLLLNAIKYTEGHIWVTVQESDGMMQLTVSDEGDGIELDEREKIFEPFQRGTQTLSHKPGTGVGLSLVRQLAKLHGGEAYVTSNKPQGSMFIVTLPAGTET